MKQVKLIVYFLIVYEGYVRKILPLNKEITISGKISYLKKISN